jgi:hypothetical protein
VPHWDWGGHNVTVPALKALAFSASHRNSRNHRNGRKSIQLGDSEVNYLVFHPIIGLGFKPADSITGCNSAKLELIKKRLVLAFSKQNNSFCISFSITFLSELDYFSSRLGIDHTALLYDLRRCFLRAIRAFSATLV